MTKDELIQRLRAALSWELAEPTQNPAFQAMLEIDRDKQEGLHINKLGVYGQYRELFDTLPDN